MPDRALKRNSPQIPSVFQQSNTAHCRQPEVTTRTANSVTGVRAYGPKPHGQVGRCSAGPANAQCSHAPSGVS